jgi:predicted Fe-Mo cluster-binding NifX family protein
VTGWQEFEVRWGDRHGGESEGAHHARVARFLRAHRVETVVAHHMGEGMLHMLRKMGLRVILGATGDAREAAVRAGE